MLITIIEPIWLVIKSLWPLWTIVAVIVLLKLIFEYWLPNLVDNIRIKTRFKSGEKWRSDREILAGLRKMDPSEFEEYVAGLFSKLGYQTEVTGGSGDGGIDVIARKNGVENYIQCKKYKNKVGPSMVRDFYGAMADHLAKGKGFLVTTGYFTPEDEMFAEDKPIELIDGNRLVEYIKLSQAASVKE
jgi:HJR/Mrr/RecB family endonuclease